MTKSGRVNAFLMSMQANVVCRGIVGGDSLTNHALIVPKTHLMIV